MQQQGTIRLADRILAAPCLSLGDYATVSAQQVLHLRKIHTDLKACVENYPVVVADDCAEYFYNSGNDYFEWAQFPNIRPAFDAMFCEFRSPSDSRFWKRAYRRSSGAFVESKLYSSFRDTVAALVPYRTENLLRANWEAIE